MSEAIFQGYKRIAAALDAYAFPHVRNEEDFQDQIARVLEDAGLGIGREVIADRGRYDILITGVGFRIVIELKVKGSVGAVERQAQRYAMTDGIDGVMVVTTSRVLAGKLKPGQLGGKPFWSHVVRTGI